METSKNLAYVTHTLGMSVLLRTTVTIEKQVIHDIDTQPKQKNRQLQINCQRFVTYSFNHLFSNFNLAFTNKHLHRSDPLTTRFLFIHSNAGVLFFKTVCDVATLKILFVSNNN